MLLMDISIVPTCWDRVLSAHIPDGFHLCES
jgi:hypothetical protein